VGFLTSPISKWKNEELEEAMDVMGKKGNFYEG
jgi:hypothetical protein